MELKSNPDGIVPIERIVGRDSQCEFSSRARN
jgi:hypothetical protein